LFNKFCDRKFKTKYQRQGAPAGVHPGKLDLTASLLVSVTLRHRAGQALQLALLAFCLVCKWVLIIYTKMLAHILELAKVNAADK